MSSLPTFVLAFSSLAFTVDVSNLTNEPQRWYRGIPSQMQQTIINGSTNTFGVNGRF